MHDVDLSPADIRDRRAFLPVCDADGDLLAVTPAPPGREAQAAAAAMDRFHDRARPAENPLRPTGFTLHQTTLLRSAAPLDAHVLLADPRPGRDGRRRVVAVLPAAAQMRLFHLMFGEQFSLEVLNHDVSERRAPLAGGRACGFRPGLDAEGDPAAEPEPAPDTVHLAFAKVRLTLHLGPDQRRFFDGVGMAQDSARHGEGAHLADFHAVRRSGRDVIGDAWRSAVERIAPVFRSALGEGAESLDRARALVAEALDAAPSAARAA